MKKVISILVTCLLVISTTLCAVVAIKTATGHEPTILGHRCFYLVSGSMEPTIPTGAAVIVRENPAGTYEVGDVITFRSAESAIYGKPNTHRIVQVIAEGGEYCYITKGDANNTVDSATVRQQQIYGKVIWNTGSMLWVGTLLGLLTTPMGFLTVIVLPLLAITVVLMRDFTKEYKKALECAAREAVQAEETTEE